MLPNYNKSQKLYLLLVDTWKLFFSYYFDEMMIMYALYYTNVLIRIFSAISLKQVHNSTCCCTQTSWLWISTLTPWCCVLSSKYQFHNLWYDLMTRDQSNNLPLMLHHSFLWKTETLQLPVPKILSTWWWNCFTKRSCHQKIILQVKLINTNDYCHTIMPYHLNAWTESAILFQVFPLSSLT